MIWFPYFSNFHLHYKIITYNSIAITKETKIPTDFYHNIKDGHRAFHY